jgi:tetratricopeptide (TPR) repeat protein
MFMAGRPSWARRLSCVLLVLIGLLGAASFAAPWLSGLEIDSAARIWPRKPLQAIARLHDAARVNPLSAEPYLVAGNIALRFNDLARADEEFSRALRRVPGDAYATLERGAIASSRGDRRAALELLGRALRLNPRDPLTRYVLQLVRRGLRLNVNELSRAILRKAQQLA